MILRTCVFLICLAGAAFAQPVEVEAEGTGNNREQAVARAVLSAVQQVNGVSIQADTVMAQATAQIATNDGSRVELSAEVRASIQQQGGGTVRSYRILSVERDETGSYVAKVWVQVERFRSTTTAGDTRRRLVVSEFLDEQRRPSEFGRQLREALLQHLTQSRRFAILDRDANSAYEQEMALLQRSAPLVEQVRVGQVLGADFIVVGTIRGVGAQRSEQQLSLTGETVVRTSARGAFDFQVLEIATRQVRWAGSASAASGGDLRRVLEDIATRVGRDISQTIYPLRVIRAEAPGEIILNQGGVTVSVGQRFRLMVLGDELRDPYTNESLGQVERDLGEIEIQRVDPRLSYAKLVSGRLPPGGSEALVRPSPPSAPRPASQPQGGNRASNRSMFD